MQGVQDQIWLKMWKTNSAELREKAVLWRKQNALTRIDRPSRIARARRLGYKAKQGIIVVPVSYTHLTLPTILLV